MQDLRRELRALKKKYKQASESERQPLTELRDIEGKTKNNTESRVA